MMPLTQARTGDLAREETRPPPIGGWNTRDPLSQMQPTDAFELTNFIPDTSGVNVRPGYTVSVQDATVTEGRIEQLYVWNSPIGEVLLGGVGGTGGDNRLADLTGLSMTFVASGLHRSRFRALAMNDRLGLLNIGNPLLLRPRTDTQAIKVEEWLFSGISDPTKLTVGMVHKNRSYFATGTDSSFWYSNVDSLGGTLTRFPVGRVSLTGGNVVDMVTWTVDGGSGIDDFAAFVLDSGEILVYQGSNPGDASNWSIVGRYNLGKILASAQFGGKIHAVTDLDYSILPDIFLTKGLQKPGKLSGAARNATKQWGGNPGWQVHFDVSKGWRIVNVPKSKGEWEQHCLNLRTGAPFKLTYPAHTFATFKRDLYFGTQISDQAALCRIEGTSDNGTAIEWSCRQAFDALNSPLPKHMLQYRPQFVANGSFSFDSGLAYDFGERAFVQSVTIADPALQSWDPGWDTAWNQDSPYRAEWLTAVGNGQRVSLFINGKSTTVTPQWHGTQYQYEIHRSL